jgi:hypothetical protein
MSGLTIDAALLAVSICSRSGAARRLCLSGEPDARQEIQRSVVEQLSESMVLERAVKYQKVARTSEPRNNHRELAVQASVLIQSPASASVMAALRRDIQGDNYEIHPHRHHAGEHPAFSNRR